MNLMITSVFPFQLMEDLVSSGIVEVESPLQRIIRLTDMISAFSGEMKDAAEAVLAFLEDGFTKLLTHSPKEQVLFDLISEHRNKKVAIIVPKAYYANILYHLNILDYFDDASFLDSKSCKYPNSAKKIAFMMRRYEEDGFTSYWL